MQLLVSPQQDRMTRKKISLPREHSISTPSWSEILKIVQNIANFKIAISMFRLQTCKMKSGKKGLLFRDRGLLTCTWSTWVRFPQVPRTVRCDYSHTLGTCLNPPRMSGRAPDQVWIWRGGWAIPKCFYCIVIFQIDICVLFNMIETFSSLAVKIFWERLFRSWNCCTWAHKGNVNICFLDIAGTQYSSIPSKKVYLLRDLDREKISDITGCRSAEEFRH